MELIYIINVLYNLIFLIFFVLFGYLSLAFLAFFLEKKVDMNIVDVTKELENCKNKIYPKIDTKISKSLFFRKHQIKPETNRNSALILEITEYTVTEDLSHLINLIISQEKKPNLIVIKIETPGGNVHDYGLIYSELNRLKKVGITIHVCIDKIAASGGYLIACAGDRIFCSDFALIGSIGVLCQFNNYYELLKRIGISIETITSVEKKLEYDEFGINSPSKIEHIKDKLNLIQNQFNDILKENRPNIELEKVCNGDYWIGQTALKLKLVDEISTCNEYILKLNTTHDILFVKKDNKKKKSFLTNVLSKIFFKQNFF